jgi:hypothetical protein
MDMGIQFRSFSVKEKKSEESVLSPQQGGLLCGSSFNASGFGGFGLRGGGTAEGKLRVHFYDAPHALDRSDV